MTFASMTLNENPAPVAQENNAAANPNANPNATISVKVSFGNDIRRVTFNGASFDSLRDLVAGLFVLDPASIVVKYQDEDEDKITMSSDGELQEALRLSKGTLRLYVETKVAQNIPAQEPAQAGEFQGQMPFWHGPFRGRHGFGGHHGHHGPRFAPWGGRGGFGPHPGFGPRGFPCASEPAGPFPHPPHPFPPHPHPPHTDPIAHIGHALHAAHHGASPSYGDNRVHAHGEFSPAPEAKEGGEYAKMHQDRKWFKERKMAYKQTIADMKAAAMTKEDMKAIKKYKEEMKEEFKAFKKQCEKREKHEKKWDKHHEKGERLMARHVADVTIPDNSELPPNAAVTKTWKLKNPGSLAWPAGCQLLFISHAGDQLSGPERVVLEAPVPPQQEVDVSVPLLTPGEPGRYVGYYRMATPDGAKFGQRVWVSFVIAPQVPANTTATTTPGSPAIPSAPTAMDQ